MGQTYLRLLALALAMLPCAAAAEDVDLTGKIAIELNAVRDAEDSCTLTFVVTNGHPDPIDKLVFETVLFDADGAVDRLTLFDFGALPVARPRVRQFAVPDLTCAGLGRVLFNDLHTCEGASVQADACAHGLVPSSRVGIEVLG